MKESAFGIPHYSEINEFLASITDSYRTANPNLFCLRIQPKETNIASYKSLYRKDFYFMSFVTNAANSTIGFDNSSLTALNSFLVFQSPGLLYSYQRSASAKGYVIYFKKECFSFFKPLFDNEFPFFDILHTNFYKLSGHTYKAYQPLFEDIFTAYENNSELQHRIASLKLLSLLYELKNFTQAHSQWEQGFTSPAQIIFKKYLQLVNNFYVEKRTIEEYASLLHITPNHLSQSIKTATDKTALSFINDRLMAEAKSLIQFSAFSIAEIAYQLNFADPTHFGKFFKKHAALTPLEYRKLAQKA
jgi:AraC family transcriptional regulator, transcriptional activator of pobA